jgi:hypothetical protein
MDQDEWTILEAAIDPCLYVLTKNVEMVKSVGTLFLVHGDTISRLGKRIVGKL